MTRISPNRRTSNRTFVRHYLSSLNDYSFLFFLSLSLSLPIMRSKMSLNDYTLGTSSKIEWTLGKETRKFEKARKLAPNTYFSVNILFFFESFLVLRLRHTSGTWIYSIQWGEWGQSPLWRSVFFVLSSLDVLLNKIGAIGTASKNQHYQWLNE